MGALEDIDLLKEKIKRFKEKGEDEEIISIFESYKNQLEEVGYDEYLINGHGIESLPENYKRQKFN